MHDDAHAPARFEKAEATLDEDQLGRTIGLVFATAQSDSFHRFWRRYRMALNGCVASARMLTQC